MNREDIFRIAKANNMRLYRGEGSVKALIAAFNQVEAETIERCAKVCDERAESYGRQPERLAQTAAGAFMFAAQSIRALSSPPAEQGPKEPKCKTCKDTKGVDHMVDGYLESSGPCPDCVGAQPEGRKCPKCGRPIIPITVHGVEVDEMECVCHAEPSTTKGNGQ